jgi:clavulanate-9-aldehyde reductase
MVVEQVLKDRERTGKYLEAEDVANAIVYALAQPEHVTVNEIMVRPRGQLR